MEQKISKPSLSSYEIPVTYFNRPGRRNTKRVLECVRSRSYETNIKVVLVPSVTGTTAIMARDILASDVSIVVVTHVTGFEKPNHQEMPNEIRQELVAKGIEILTAQHAFGGVGRAIRKKLGTYQVDEIIAYTLRMFGQGTKVAIELGLMVADAGLIRTDEDVISLGGTEQGVDTALVIQPAYSADYLKLKIREVICKPAKF